MCIVHSKRMNASFVFMLMAPYKFIRHHWDSARRLQRLQEYVAFEKQHFALGGPAPTALF
jgi:hypothetical protein